MIRRFETRDEWLAARRGWIGASDVSAIMGRNRYRGEFATWVSKTRGIPEQAIHNPMAEAGHRHEPTIARWFEEKSGEVTDRECIVDPGEHTVYVSDERPHMACTPDRLMCDKTFFVSVDEWKIENWAALQSPNSVLQLKCAWYKQARRWEKACPLEYQIQVQAELYCLDLDVGYYGVLLNGWDFRWYKIERNARFEKVMLSKCDEFWRRVQNNDPPPTDYTEGTRDALEALYNDPNDDTIYLDPELDGVHKVRESAGAEITRQTRIKDGATHKLIDAIGNGRIGILSDGVTAYKLKRKDGKTSLRKTRYGR